MFSANHTHKIRKRLLLFLSLAVTPIMMLFSNLVSAQALTINVPGIPVEDVAPLAPISETSDQDPSFTPYATRQYQPLLRRGLQFQEAGEHEAALDLLNRAWQISRVNLGLYHEEQIPVLKSIVYSELETRDWESVDRIYDYMTHLYKQLYDIEDPRFEKGLQMISSFHIAAFNANLDGESEYHLRKANQLLELRLESAESSLADDHPRMQYLNESIALSRKYLYLMSDRYKQMLARQENANRERLFAELD